MSRQVLLVGVSNSINIMMSVTNNNYRNLLEEKLHEKLFLHSLGVAKSAWELACYYGADRENAYRAGLLHDYGKKCDLKEQYREAERLKLKLDPVTWKEAQLLHAPVGAELVRREMGVEDGQVLRAILCHTTGAPGMDILGQVVYLADYIEDGRSYPGVEKLRQLAYKDLDLALFKAVENTIKKIMQKGNLLHPLSVAFRNELLCRLKKGRGKLEIKDLLFE